MNHRKLGLLMLMLTLLAGCVIVLAQEDPVQPQPPAVALNLNLNDGADWAAVAKILLLMTLLSFLPAILFGMTCFTRILIVLSFARQTFGVQNLPPNQVLIGLALFLTAFVMTPVWEKVYHNAWQPYQSKQINTEEAWQRGIAEFHTFMRTHTREKDLALMIYLSKQPAPASDTEISLPLLVPAFIVSELTIAFQMGFMILLPFLIVDIVVASTLLAMGMMMVPPAVVATPFKILLFILVDGWHLVVKNLVLSYG